MTSNRIGNVGTVVLVLCVVAVTASTLRRDWVLSSTRSAAGSRRVAKPIDDWGRYANAGHVLGARQADLTIVEFADFQCPACKLLEHVLDSLQASGEQFRRVYRHYPLAAHPKAMPSVRASECAAAQGEFAAMHKLLFANVDSVGVAPWTWFARQAGLSDVVAFERCVHSAAPLHARAIDTADAKQLGIRGTPLLLIGDLLVEGVPQSDSLVAYLR
ncbi:MAG: thioredoxin domain-containing protein, partial [Gemmatimonadaceae bacterium]|nr:thioredoxin domain-containing protein [Gemmatimonadaceae bacterium]